MTLRTAGAMHAAALLLRGLTTLNIVGFFVFAAVLAGSFTDVVAKAVREDLPGLAPESALLAVRLVMVIAMLTVPLAHVVLTRLSAVVATVEAGDPFIAGNARHLTSIAWALLGIQLLDLGFGAVSLQVEPSQFGWSPSVTGWLAVILLFVLAKVFDHGSRMRDDLAGTV